MGYDPHPHLLVDPDRSKLEIRIFKGLRIIVHVVDTSRRATRRAIHRCITGPVSAECQVDNNIVRTKVGGKVTIGVWEVRSRRTPTTGINDGGSQPDIEGS